LLFSPEFIAHNVGIFTMASNKNKDPEKTVDVPPYGSRNPDPITDSPGSHPIETGIGALIGGAASGAAAGAVGGPIGAVVGAIVGGGLAGGLAGKGVGELIDPTTEDNWLREYSSKSADKANPDAYRPAYRYGIESGSKYTGRRFEEVETDLRSGWESSHAKSGVAWDQARPAVRDAFDRTIKLHEERLNVTKESVKTGEVGVRKEVITEHKQITVPVEREEVVIERRPATGTSTGAIRAEEIRIPVKEEQVHVTKETVLKEEVTVGKRKVQDTKTVEGDVRREEVKVETEGKTNVRSDKK
jgi:uncharacterized protein (TIGR02271 family)